MDWVGVDTNTLSFLSIVLGVLTEGDRDFI